PRAVRGGPDGPPFARPEEAFRHHELVNHSALVLGTTCTTRRHPEPRCTVLKKLSIAQRIYGAFAALLALLVVVGLAGFVGVQAVSAIFTDYRAAASQTQAIGELVGDVTGLRLLGANYREDADPATAEAFTA